MKPLRILCTGLLAGKTIGHIDQLLVYVVALRRLGHDVIFVDDVGAYRCRDTAGNPVPFAQWSGRIQFERVMIAYGLWPRCCLLYENGQATHGLSVAELRQAARQCDLLLTRSGRVRTPELIESIPCRVYVDANPGKTQVLLADRGPDYQGLNFYNHFFTVGLNIGGPACPDIPTVGRQWHPLFPPVDLSAWPAANGGSAPRFTTISSWSGRSTFTWQGQSTGEKADNWHRYIELPQHTSQELEIALQIDRHADAAVVRRFQANGWWLTDPGAWDALDDYRGYINGSRGEFSVAHDRCVRFQDGWFSDRTARYLAAGKPVVIQSTGIESHLPVGQGVLTFRTMTEAVAGLERVNRDYAAHCQAARRIAEEYFDADRSLARLLEIVGCC